MMDEKHIIGGIVAVIILFLLISYYYFTQSAVYIANQAAPATTQVSSMSLYQTWLPKWLSGSST